MGVTRLDRQFKPRFYLSRSKAEEYAPDGDEIVEYAPVRHGHWIYHPDDLFPNDSTQECSYCHAEESLTLYNENYCPNCGARMDEVIE